MNIVLLPCMIYCKYFDISPYSSISFPNEPLISWTFLDHFCHHFWVGLLLLCCCTHPKVVTIMAKKFSTDQRFIRKRNTTYKIHTLIVLLRRIFKQEKIWNIRYIHIVKCWIFTNRTLNEKLVTKAFFFQEKRIVISFEFQS